ncbi:MAG TPA: hypothetical protein VG755_25070 [Nannocystaceae bacterium]|nr:hypothetical protein [Nannocystaceae bacterium]
MGTLLPLLAALAVPVVQVDGDGLAEHEARRTTGHVIERLLEVGIAVDPRAPTKLVLTRTPKGYAIALRIDDATLATSELAEGGGGAQLGELELVQVAVDLARAHAKDSDVPLDAVRVVTMPGAASARAEAIAATMATNRAVVPASVATDRVLCVDRRDEDIVVAAVADADACSDALAEADVGGELEIAIVDALAPAEPPPEPPPRNTVTSERTPAPRAQTKPHPPWSLGAVIGLGFAWRQGFDAAPTLGFVAASPRGLALAFDAIFLPSRAQTFRAIDSMLAFGLGYRARPSTRARLSVIPAAGLSLHGAWLDGAATPPRVDPLLLLPLHVEAVVHRHVAVGARVGIGTTFRPRSHSVRGLELWHRGALLVFAMATVRFGT